MNISELSELLKMVGFEGAKSDNKPNGISDQIGEKVIVRTYSAGVHFGTLVKKDGNEVILVNSKRIYRYQTVKSISLSSIAKYGINQSQSKITPEVEKIWLEAIEIITLSEKCINSIESADEYNEI